MEMKLAEEFFFSLTPRQFYWLRDRHKLLVEHEELLHAITTSTLANHSMSAPKKAYVPNDFMPSKLAVKFRKKQAATPKRRWTRKTFAQELFTLGRSANPFFKVVPRPAPLLSGQHPSNPLHDNFTIAS